MSVARSYAILLHALMLYAKMYYQGWRSILLGSKKLFCGGVRHVSTSSKWSRGSHRGTLTTFDNETSILVETRPMFRLGIRDDSSSFWWIVMVSRYPRRLILLHSSRNWCVLRSIWRAIPLVTEVFAGDAHVRLSFGDGGRHRILSLGGRFRSGGKSFSLFCVVMFADQSVMCLRRGGDSNAVDITSGHNDNRQMTPVIVVLI